MNFDIDRYLGQVAALDDSDIDYESFRARPLDDDTLRCLRYMHDVEHHTTCYLRDLLVTSAHEDPEVTSFLAMWAFEEFWHGEAIGKVLAVHDETFGRERIAAARSRVGRERLRTLGFMALSGLTDHVVAIAMTWGAINEWTTQAGYLRLASTAGNDELATLLRRIAKQEGRHIDFYASQAEQRLADPGAQKWTRRALNRAWSPVGSTVMPKAETDHLVRTLFGGDDGAAMAGRIDRRVDRLPGLAGLGLVEGVRRDVIGDRIAA
ncbi:MAG: ferritin-like domain-containing protein [Ilumatobacter sp.]|nr:ferritin-like domain-containing protein [Ilumatobacter sp.]